MAFIRTVKVLEDNLFFLSTHMANDSSPTAPKDADWKAFYLFLAQLETSVGHLLIFSALLE